MKKNPVIVYNCSYNGLSIIQELGSLGIPCIAIDYRLTVGAFSKFSRFKLCPNPLKDEPGFIEFLYKECASLSLKPVLFPTNDEWALVTAKHKNRLSEVAYPCVSNFGTVDIILAKDIFYKIGQENDYMTPHSWGIENVQNVTNDVFPIVAKAKYKSLPGGKANLSINKALKENRLVVLENKNHLDVYIKKCSTLLSHLVFQEYISGDSSNMFTIGIFADAKSDIKALFSGRKVRGYPADIGDNILGESHSVPQLLVENTKRVVKEMAYTGIAEFEYKRDQYTGEYCLIEINPRPWSWIGITPYCGVNIPYIAYRSMIGQRVVFRESVAETSNVKYVKIYQDLFNCLIRYRFHHTPWHYSYAEWKKTLKASKLIIAEWHKGDWPIVFVSIPYLIGKLLFQRWR